MSWLSRHIHMSLLFIGFLSTFNVYALNSVDGVRIWPAPENTRVVFDLSAQPTFTYFTLTNPNRLVIDFQDTKNGLSLVNVINEDKRIEKIRHSTPKEKNDSRLVLDLADKYELTVFSLTPAGQYGHRLVVDLFDTEKINQQKAQSKPQVTTPPALRDTIIGIDAGHGGEDPGSIGPRGTYEKRVTLAIAKKLERMINNENGMKAVMIRTGDYYVDLDRRTSLARAKEVDFLVSIHADAFTSPQPSGASVWVVSNKRAESELARYLDNRQLNSELLGGGGEVIKTTDDDNLAWTLADMSREHSLEVSISIADNVLAQLKNITKLHKKTTQYKSLAVLKSSDIPSILVETGFISNHREEQNLLSDSHQEKLASAIHNGIKKFFMERPLTGSYFASIGYRQHKVVSGDSLSELAQRYNVSVSELKALNSLTSNTVRIGQTLKIPRA